LLADQPFKRGDPGFVLLKEVCRCSVLVEGPGLIAFDPDADQIARDVVALLQAVKRLAGEKFLGDLTLEFDAVGSIANSDAFRPPIPISFRPGFRFEAGHHSEMKPAT
jgi:hypothetical protein